MYEPTRSLLPHIEHIIVRSSRCRRCKSDGAQVPFSLWGTNCKLSQWSDEKWSGDEYGLLWLLSLICYLVVWHWQDYWWTLTWTRDAGWNQHKLCIRRTNYCSTPNIRTCSGYELFLVSILGTEQCLVNLLNSETEGTNKPWRASVFPMCLIWMCISWIKFFWLDDLCCARFFSAWVHNAHYNMTARIFGAKL